MKIGKHFKQVGVALLVVLSHWFCQSAFSCNVCGGSSGGSYVGILPQFSKNFIGIKYLNKGYVYNTPTFSTFGSGLVKEEYFNTLEAWGRVYPSKKVQLFFFVPYSFNTRKEESRVVEIDGVGDASLMANYQIINRTADSLKVKQVILGGFGIKLPTGKYQQRDENKTMFPLSFQVGNGSYALMANAIYNIRYKRIGLNADVSYRINSTNELSYKPGNQLNYSVSLFYWQNIGNKSSVLSQSGIFYEGFDKDMEYDRLIDGTGVQNIFWNAGIDLYVNNVIVGLVAQIPAWVDNNYLLPEAKSRVMADLRIMF